MYSVNKTIQLVIQPIQRGGLNLIIRRLGNELRREHLLPYCDRLPIFLEEALSRRPSWKLRVGQAPMCRKWQISSSICAHRSKVEMDSSVLAVAAGLYQTRNFEVWSPHPQKTFQPEHIFALSRTRHCQRT